MAISKITASGVATDTLTAADIADDAIGTAELANDVVISTSGSITTTGGMTVDGATVFNEASADVDFRIEGNGEANMFVVDAGNDRVGIGTNAPDSNIHLKADSGDAIFKIETVSGGDSTLTMKGFANRNNVINFEDNTGIAGRIIYDHNDNEFQFYTNGISTADMVINSSGNVGIGTATPGRALEIYGADEASMGIRWTTAENHADARNWEIALNQTNYGIFDIRRGTSIGAAPSTSVMSFNSSGRVFIGANTSNSPWADTSGPGTLRFNATASAENNNIAMSSDTSNGYAMFYMAAIDGANNERFFSFVRNDSQIGRIELNGTTGVSYEVTSDYRLKENVEPITGSVARLKKIKPSKYNFISEPDRECEGFIAHELQEYVPQAVGGVKDEMWPEVLFTSEDELPEGKKIGDVKHEEKINPQGIDFGRLTPVLVGALQEIITRVEALENA